MPHLSALYIGQNNACFRKIQQILFYYCLWQIIIFKEHYKFKILENIMYNFKYIYINLSCFLKDITVCFVQIYISFVRENLCNFHVLY